MRKILINSYFRSGSTAIWSIINDLNQENIISYYEPCHPLLVKNIKVERGRKSTLHNTELWSAYEGVVDLLPYKHPYLGKLTPNSAVGIAEYTDFLCQHAASQGKSALLQTNRWHFFTPLFVEREYKVIHVIRDPKEVVDSIVNLAFQENNKVVSFSKKVALHFGLVDHFEQESFFNLVCSMSDTVHLSKRAVFRRLLTSFEDRVLFSWIVSNHYVLRQSRRVGIDIVSYNLLCNQDKEHTSRLESAGVFFDVGRMKSKNNESNRKGVFRKKAETFGLLKEYDELMEVIGV